MSTAQLIEAIRQEFLQQLETTGAYNKAGMTLAFERAVTAALTRWCALEVGK